MQLFMLWSPTFKEARYEGVKKKQYFVRIIYFYFPGFSKDGLGETKAILSLPKNIPYDYASFLTSPSSCLKVSCFWSPNL